MSSFAAWKDKILLWLVTALIAGAVTGFSTWARWVTLSTGDRPTREEVKLMIRDEAPYTEDRNLILERLKSVSGIEDKLLRTIERNTEAINSLKVEIARLQAGQPVN